MFVPVSTMESNCS